MSPVEHKDGRRTGKLAELHGGMARIGIRD